MICKVIGLPDSLAKLQALILQNLPGKLFTMDNFDSLRTPSVCREATTGCDTSFESFIGGLRTRHDRRPDYNRYRQQLDR